MYLLSVTMDEPLYEWFFMRNTYFSRFELNSLVINNINQTECLLACVGHSEFQCRSVVMRYVYQELVCTLYEDDRTHGDNELSGTVSTSPYDYWEAVPIGMTLVFLYRIILL